MSKPPESEQSRYARMCGFKRKFATEAEATVNGSRVYRCPYCKGFHRTQLRAKAK